MRAYTIAIAFTLSHVCVYARAPVFRLTIIQLTWQKIYTVIIHTRTYVHVRHLGSSSYRLQLSNPCPGHRSPYTEHITYTYAYIRDRAHKKIESLKKRSRARFSTIIAVKSSGCLTLDYCYVRAYVYIRVVEHKAWPSAYNNNNNNIIIYNTHIRITTR